MTPINIGWTKYVIAIRKAKPNGGMYDIKDCCAPSNQTLKTISMTANTAPWINSFSIKRMFRRWLRILLSLSILRNPVTYRFFSWSSANSIIIKFAVPIHNPAAFKTHAFEKIEPVNDVVGLSCAVVC